MNCPICYKTMKEQKSWVSYCPLYQKSVCENHCFGCEHQVREISLYHCKLKEKKTIENPKFAKIGERYSGRYYFIGKSSLLISSIDSLIMNSPTYWGKIKYKLSRYHIEVVGADEKLVREVIEKIISLNEKFK